MKTSHVIAICITVLAAALVIAFGPRVWDAITTKEQPLCIGVVSPAEAERLGCRLD